MNTILSDMNWLVILLVLVFMFGLVGAALCLFSAEPMLSEQWRY